MKNFIQSIRGLYATLILLVALLATTLSATAQTRTGRIPFMNIHESYSQMWNTSSTNWYFGTVTIGASGVPSSSNYGNQLDTGASGANLQLSTSMFTDGYVNDDTAIAQAIPGYGVIKFTSVMLKAGAVTSINPTVTVTPKSSSDFINWSTIPGVTAATITPTSLTVPVVTKFSITGTDDRFYALFYTGDGVTSYSAQAYCFFRRQVILPQ